MTKQTKQTIRRADHGADPFFRMARITAQDAELSYDALGVIAYLLSKSDGWCIQPSDLERCACGRDKTYKILRELIDKGYMDRIIHRDAKGRTEAVEYVLYEKPLPEKPDMDNPDTENTHIRYKREEDTKDIASGKPTRKRQPDSVFDALATHVFEITDVTPQFGGRIGKLRKALLALEPDAEGVRLSGDIATFVRWYKSRYADNVSIPRDPDKFLEHWQAWRSANGMTSFEAALRGMKIEEYRP